MERFKMNNKLKTIQNFKFLLHDVEIKLDIFVEYVIRLKKNTALNNIRILEYGKHHSFAITSMGGNTIEIWNRIITLNSVQTNINQGRFHLLMHFKIFN